MIVRKTKIEGVFIVEPEVFRDERGYFKETYRKSVLEQAGLDIDFVQDNYSYSTRGVVRGLHYQTQGAAQSKLIMVPRGEILDVAVDLRRNSATFGQHISVRIGEENHRMMLISEGFAHGFSVLSEDAAICYKCSSYYDREQERGIRWDDPRLGIDWQVVEPIVSKKDRSQPLLQNVSEEDLLF